ncbi:MAG TPA: cobalt-precorrin-5B (C(1))-methyltransferase [Syntrophobacteraceae bacterium]|nr:cobalt-precorrin-5B (C(1))-methyltransferase [Syntrophobacteraceae bacterium]
MEPNLAQAKRNKVLGRGFSTGTAATAAARAALRGWLTRSAPSLVAVRLPGELWYPVPVAECSWTDDQAEAAVIKDAGDDPDVTHRARIVARVLCRAHGPLGAGVLVRGGEGVGTVTKVGLPVHPGEPAINPVPRNMIRDNLQDELGRLGRSGKVPVARRTTLPTGPGMAVWLPFDSTYGGPPGLVVEVEIAVPRGKELARYTLNPRLGIVGGISILGTSGIVKPFSNEAYQETIDSALQVAAANARPFVVLSTGGKSERLARSALSSWDEEAFVQIADFFAYAVKGAAMRGFKGIVHSVFFGKAIKMAQGQEYTHAHRSPLDLLPMASLAEQLGYEPVFCQELANANTARHALELLQRRQSHDLIVAIAREALERSRRFSGCQLAVRLLLFDYDGAPLADLQSPDWPLEP